MKYTPWFSRYTPSFRTLRIALASILVLAGAALGFVSTKTSSPPLLAKSDSLGKPSLNKFRMDRDELFGSKRAMPGPGKDGGPLAAAEQDYANRAYPATEIPFDAAVKAQAAFEQVKARGNGASRGGRHPRTQGAAKNTPSQWALIGPSHADFPDILTFSGASYTTSGRITALAIAPNCGTNGCRLWVAAAGGGIWRTDNALSGNGPNWTFLSDSFGTNAIGTLTYDAANNTLYAGTGEPNASGDSEAGRGIYKSTDGGITWTHLTSTVTALTTPGNGTYTGDAFADRSISTIVVDPTNANILYVSSTRGVRGVTSVTGGATTRPPLPRPPFGLFKSTDGGANFTFIWNGNGTNRGVNHIALDPTNPSILYAAAFNQGTWRSTDGGTTFSLIKARLTSNDPDRAEFAVNTLLNGKTRLYLGEGAAGSPAARFFRTDDATAASPVFTDLTTTQNINYCTGQCWYDNVVFSPAGYPDSVYLLGSFLYGEYGFRSNGRAVLYSTDAGASFTDETWDATTNATPPGTCCQPNPIAPNGIHPDQHALVVNPSNPGQFFEGSDGGLVRSSGDFADISAQCDARPLGPTSLALCHQLLSRVPTQLYVLNKGLSTLQFQSLSVNPFDVKTLMGGTQDNGTFGTTGSAVVWPQLIYGDGGQSGFNAADPALRFNSFFGQNHDANFQSGDPTKWVIISAPIAGSPEDSNFYVPIIADPNPASAGTIFEGSQSVWRTQDWGGNQAYLEANCAEFTTSGTQAGCGDFVQIGPVGSTDLTAGALGTRAGGFVAAVTRVKTDTGTLWAATTSGRVLISKNADAAASSVTYTRLDTLPSATAAPGRFVSGIYIDPANPNHAWISYSGYNFNTPSQPGHVFEVTYNGTNDATWTRIDAGPGGLADLPATSIARDDLTGDIYASSDFGVMRLPSNSTTWLVAGAGLPKVEVAGLTIVPSSRKLFAATHGRSAWALTLP